MKKFYYIGGFFALAIAAVGLFRYFGYSSDNLIRQKMVGRWSVDSDPARTIENRADGSFTVSYAKGATNEVAVEGIWSVSGGYVIGTITNSTMQIPSWDRTESNRIVSVDDGRIVMHSFSEGTNRLTLRRK